MPIPELAESARASSPTAPAPIPGSSLLNAVESNAQSLRAGVEAPRSQLLDTIGQEAESLRQYEDQKRRAMYGIPVSDEEYSLISSALAMSSNPDEERWNWASAKMYSQRLGIPMESARANLESISQAWLQSPNVTNGKGHFEAIADSFRVGDMTMDAATLAKQWKDSGGQDQGLERKIDAIYSEMAKMQDRFPRGIIPTALKFGAESAPFMAQVLGKGVMAGGAAAAAVAVGTASMGGTAATFGLAAPVGAAAMASALTLAASQTGSFMASMQIMEALDYYDMRKKGVSHEIASPMATISGGIQATLESFLGNVPGLLGKVGGKAITGISGNIAKGLLISGKAGALGTALMGYAGEVLEEGAEEAFQSISSDVIKNIAYGLSDAGIEQAEAGEIAKNAWDNFKGGALASLGYGVPGAFIGYKGAARQSKALKEFAGITDRETFIEQAGKWQEIESVPEEQRKAALTKIWEKVQQKAKEARETETPAGEVKPFKRTEAGTLYTEETTVAHSEEGKVEAILKVGDSETKERLGYLKYQITEDGIVLENARFKKGYEGIREEAIQELAAKYPDLPITAVPGAPDTTRAAIERLEQANPRGTGANWYTGGTNQDTERARAKLRLAIADNMPKVSPVQREAAILLHEFRANAKGQAFDEYLKAEFSNGIIGTDMGRVSAAQGQRAGILFTKDGQELQIGQFVRDAKALVMVTEKSDFVSFVHESGHLFRKQLIGTDLGGKLEEAYGIVGGTWTREHEERFTDDLVKYLSYGEAKDEKLRSVFSRIAEWITRLWSKVLNQADVDPRIRAVMDELFKSEQSPLSETAQTSVIAEEGLQGTRRAEGDTTDGEAGEKGIAVPQSDMGGDTALFQLDMETVDRIETMVPIKVSTPNLPKATSDIRRWMIEKFRSFGSVVNVDTGREVELVISAAKKVSQHLAKRDTAAIVADLPEIVEKSIFLDAEENQKPEVKRILEARHYAAMIELDGKPRLVTLTTQVYQGREQLDQLKNWQVEKKEAAADRLDESGAAASPMGREPHKNRIVELIRDVKPDFLFEETNDNSTLYQYVGERAELDDTEKKNLSVAKEMAQAGKDSETVRLATGWFKGKYDGKWRMETDPLKLKVSIPLKVIDDIDGQPSNFKIARLDEVLDSPILEKYPELKDYTVQIGFGVDTLTEGSFSDTGKVITIYLRSKYKEIDRMQNVLEAVDSGLLEKYAKVDFESGDYATYEEAIEDNKRFFNKERAKLEEIRADKTPLTLTINDEKDIRAILTHELQHAIQNLEGFARGGNPGSYLRQINQDLKALQDDIEEYGNLIRLADTEGERAELETERQKLTDEYDKMLSDRRGTAQDQYTRTAGEIEARDVASRMGLSQSQREALAPYSSENISAEDAVVLFQLDDDAINAEAATFESWQAWKEYVEGYAIPAFGEDTRAPEGATEETADGWYAARWEAAHAKVEEEAAVKRVESRKEARRGQFAATMAKAGGVESMLSAIWDAEVQAFDTTQASDEQESIEIDQAYEWKKELAQRLADHPLVLLAAQSVGQGKKLSPSTRKAILTYIRHNEVEFAALYAELTGDLDLAQFAEAGRAKLQSIPDPKLERYADMSIAERTALLNNISDKEVRDRIKAGAYDDDYLADYVRRLEESKKSLTKESEDAKAEIEKLGGELENESDFALKMYDRSKAANKALESKEKELEKVKAAKERVETAKASYVEALGSARDESKLSAKIAKKEYLAALNEARREAAFQARFVAAEIRATAKLRAQRDANRRAIMKKPAKNIIWEKRQEILTIQEYLRSKKWEYIEEIDDTGKKSRRRAYDTVVGEDGKKHKVPRYTTVQAERMKAALSMLLRETPGLMKILTNEMVDRINDKPVSAWTLAELQDLRSIIDRIAKEGREAYELKEMMRRREAAADRYDIENSIRKNKRYKNPTAHGSDEERVQRKKMEGFATWELPAMKMRYFAPLLDNGTEGVNTKLLVEDEYKARRQKQHEKVRRLRKVQTRMRELNMTQKDRQRKITIPGIGPGATDVTMTAAKLSHVALMLRNDKARSAFVYGNLFSEHERSKMTRDFLQANGDAKTTKLLKAIKDNLTVGEKEIIDLIAEGFGGAEFDRQNKAVIDLTNEEMKPEANYSPLYREGSYFESQKDSIVDSMKAKYGFVVNPDSGFTIARINIAPEHQSPVRVMDIVSMYEDAVDTQEHLIAYGAYVKKLHSVYQNQQQSKAVREGIIQTFGKDGMGYVDKYIASIANPNADSGSTPGDKALRKLRGYQAVGFLAFRWTSVTKQLITSPLPYMAYAPKETLAAAFQALSSGHIMKFIAEIEGKSEMLQSRTIDQIFESIKAMDAEGWEGFIKKVGTTGMKGLEFADRISVAIGWKGVYDKELLSGATEAEAIKKADDITFQTQPSSNPADLAPIYRDMNEWKRILLMFTSSLNTVYNNIRHGVPKAIREREYGQAIGIVASYAIAGTLLGAFAKSLGKDPPPDDPDEWWRQWIYYSMTQFTDSVPIIGSEVTSAMKRLVAGDKKMPFGEDTLPTVSAIIQGFDSLSKGEIEKAAENFAEGVGLATGFPTLAIEEYAKNLKALKERKE